jgi:uncharacterized protein (TIGR01777 family)
MKVAVTGSHGLIGKALCTDLGKAGHEVWRIVRTSSASGANEICWNPASGSIEAAKLESFDAVVHLAGENIAGQRWTEAHKRKILESRIQSTTLLAKTIAQLSQPPKVVASGSAIGFYGDRGSEKLTEASNPGTGFLAGVCRDWEDAIDSVQSAGVRVVKLRTGVVLSTEGGALAKMLPVFQLGGGGIIGSGQQYMSWISTTDEVKAIEFVLENSHLTGPVNLVAPNAVTNAQFTKALGQVLHRPTFLPLPAFAAKIVLGEMADELLLSSQLVVPTKLSSAGFTYQFPKLEDALRQALASHS